MSTNRSQAACWAGLAVAVVLLAACAGGDGSRWKAEEAEPAGFFAGLWHGLLLVVTLVVSFFTDEVSIYETNNVGVVYNIGFVLGTLMVYGSGIHVSFRKKRPSSDWDGFSERVERNVKQRIARAVEDEDLEELGAKVEQKVKERLRRWLEEDERKGGADEG